MRLGIFGAYGYSGGNIAQEALARGHEVIAVSRREVGEGLPDVIAMAGSVYDADVLAAVCSLAEVVVLAVPAFSDAGLLADAVPGLLKVVETHGTRLGVVGGAGSLAVTPGGPALYDTPEFPAAIREASQAQGRLLEALQADGSAADWFYLSPAGSYGKHTPGERTGSYRLGGDLLLTDDAGRSFISGADYAIAFLDEIERPAHRRTRFTVAY